MRRRHDDVLAVWMGTGLGAGLVLDGRLRVGPHGLAGELGHAVVVPGGRRARAADAATSRPTSVGGRSRTAARALPRRRPARPRWSSWPATGG